MSVLVGTWKVFLVSIILVKAARQLGVVLIIVCLPLVNNH